MFSLFHRKKKESAAEEEKPAVPEAAPAETEQEEREDMMEGVTELDTLTVKDVMVPRIDVTFVQSEIPREKFLEIIRESGFSRYPVIEGEQDNVIGILYAKDVLCNGLGAFHVKSLMRKAYFVPESKHLDDLLRDFRRKRVHIAVAVDEFGGVSGIVCMEDILEVIVGDIEDEFDDEREDVMISRNPDGTATVDARIPVDDFNEKLGYGIDGGECETLGGYVFGLFGTLPEKGEKTEDAQAAYTVEGISGHTITSIRVARK